ncbi:zinc ribbon domain-containing protein [Latilactobacillus sakei]|uniref:zinc ribbon domain-containing protein n=1 Tax=Latilactobacillus sakei TaxID=1599 RepID=UPI000DC64386|nr:zinc ribbon domain-containing protein [Latilactobacillus sakei]SPS07558.1 hypothetical protein LAS9624_01814 [Latilactobacillus sakei]
MKCPSCHTENKQGAKFCVKCGAALVIQPLSQMQTVQPNQAQAVTNSGNGASDKKRLAIIIMIIALIAGGSYFWFSKNTTREIAGEWRMTELNGKDTNDKPGSLEVNSRGEAIYNAKGYFKLTGIKLAKEKGNYKIVEPESIRIKPSADTEELLKLAAQKGYVTKHGGSSYGLRPGNISKLNELKKLFVINSTYDRVIKDLVQDSYETILVTITGVSALSSEDLKITKTAGGKLEIKLNGGTGVDKFEAQFIKK